MDNFKIISLLDATPLSPEERHNILTIFSSLREDRKMDIIDNWWVYLDRILKIQNKAESERKEYIQSTFERINHMIDEAYLRDQEEKAQAEKQKLQQQQEMISAMDYDQKRRLDMIARMNQEQQEAREKLLDPLQFL